MARVQLHQVTKLYPGNPNPAVSALSLDIPDREFIVLVGPSGCGKSTTLRMIAGLEDITAGTIAIGDRVVNHIAPKDRDIAMVFQNYALYPHMSVYKNLAFGLQLRRRKLGLSRQDIDARVREAARILGISEFLDRKPKALSGGQRQRVAVGRAIVRQPQAFLFDEPLSNLDAKLRVETRAELKKLHLNLKTTTIYVTHDQEEAMTLGDRIVVMKDGVIHQVAPPLEVYERPANRFVAGFVGTPPMNFFAGTLDRAGDQSTFNMGGQQVLLGGSAGVLAGATGVLGAATGGLKGVLGVRPEALGLVNEGRYRGEQNSLKCKVLLTEPLGDKVDVYLATEGNDHLVCRADAATLPPVAPGQEVPIYLDLNRCHLFEPGDNGRNLSHL